MNTSSPIAGKSLHPIKVVVRRTGLSAHVIRIWEKRYGAVVPERTETNRRLYSDAEVERLALLRQATESGHNIGQIAALSADDLRDLISSDRAIPDDLHANQESAHGVAGEIETCMEWIRALDADSLRKELDRASVVLTLPVLLEDLVIPLMHEIGDEWEAGNLRVVHEHLAFAVVRSFLGSLRTAYAPTASAPHLTVATPSGQLHELGALVVAAAATGDGWNVTYLGAGLPAEEIARAVETHDSAAVALSIVYPSDDPGLPSELERLRRCLPDSTKLVVGGRSAGSYAEAIANAGGKLVTSLRETREELGLMRMN